MPSVYLWCRACRHRRRLLRRRRPSSSHIVVQQHQPPGYPLPCITLLCFSVSSLLTLTFDYTRIRLGGFLLPAVAAAPLPRLLRVLVRLALVARVLQLDGLPHLDRAAGRLDPAGRRAEVGEDEGDVLARVGVRVVFAHLCFSYG